MTTEVAEAPVETSAAPAPVEEAPVNPLLDGQDLDAVESEEVSEEPQAPQVPKITDVLAQLGFEDVKDDDAADRLKTAYERQQEQINELRRQNEQLSPLAQYGTQFLQQQQQAAQPQPEPSAENNWWSPPQVDVDMVRKFKVRKEDGNVGWADNTPPELRAQGEAYEEYVDKWADQLLNHPDQALRQVVEAEFDRLFEQKYQSQTAKQQEEHVINEIFEKNQEWLFDKDPVTKRPAMNSNGGFKFSPAGQQAVAYLQQAEEIGIKNPAHQWNYVLTALTAQQASQQRAQSPQPTQPSPPDPRLEHLRSVAQNTPQRTGSFDSPGQELRGSQNRNLSAGQQLIEQLRADGEM